MAQERFSRLRRAEIDVDLHIAGAGLLRHALAPSFEKDAVVVTPNGINSMLTEIRAPTIADAGPKLSIGRVVQERRRSRHFRRTTGRD